MEGLSPWRDSRLHEASSLHRKNGLILAPYAVTTWDEFQSLASEIRHAPRLILELRLHFQPRSLRIGVGIGQLKGKPGRGKPVNTSLGGPAFENAREAIESLKRHRKDEALTSFRSPDPDLDMALNLIYHLHDTLLRQVTPRQWETIGAHLRSRSQELTATAKRMGIDVSTVSRNLQRGYYGQMHETLEIVGRLLEGRFGRQGEAEPAEPPT
jgi:hypothetical protein